MFATAGWGWHAEVAVHVLRLVLSGTLDHYPALQLIIGHMGEGLPAMLARCDQVLGRETPAFLQRSVSQTILDQVHVTPAASSRCRPSWRLCWRWEPTASSFRWTIRSARTHRRALLRRVAGLARGQGEDRPWQRRPAASTADVTRECATIGSPSHAAQATDHPAGRRFVGVSHADETRGERPKRGPPTFGKRQAFREPSAMPARSGRHERRGFSSGRARPRAPAPPALR